MKNKLELPRSLIFFLFIAVASLGSHAWAGYLTIIGQPELKATVSPKLKDHIQISGSYRIENRGDESAHRVFPSFQIGQWFWTGEPKSLAAGGSFTWEIDAQVPFSQLGCAGGEDCEDAFLPQEGVYPLRARRHYSDSNGREFSAADIYPIEIANLGTSQLARLRVPEIEGQLEFRGNGQSFEGGLEIRNFSSSRKRVLVSFFTSRELRVLTKSSVQTLQADSLQYFPVKAENYTGLNGSTYAFYGSLEWDQEGMRNSALAVSQVVIEKPKRRHWLVFGAIGVFLVLGGVLYLRVLRKSA